MIRLIIMGRDNGTISVLSDDMKNCLEETEETNKVLSDRISNSYIERYTDVAFCIYARVYVRIQYTYPQSRRKLKRNVSRSDSDFREILNI